MKKLKTLLIATAVAAVVIPGFAATTTETESITISLTGYEETDYEASTDGDGTLIQEQKLQKFKITTEDVITAIGDEIGKEFSKKATMYVDDGQVVIVDDGVSTTVTNTTVSAYADTDSSVESYKSKDSPTNKKKYSASGKGYSTGTFRLRVGDWNLAVEGFTKESFSENWDYAKETGKESYSATSEVSGELETEEESDLPVSGTIKSKYTSTTK